MSTLRKLEGLSVHFSCISWITETGKSALHVTFVADASHWCDALIYSSVAARSPSHPSSTGASSCLLSYTPRSLVCPGLSMFSRLPRIINVGILILFRGIPWTRRLCEDHEDQQQHPSPWTNHRLSSSLWMPLCKDRVLVYTLWWLE